MVRLVEEDDEQRQERLGKMRQADAVRRAEEDDEQRQERLAKKRAAEAVRLGKKRANEDAEHGRTGRRGAAGVRRAEQDDEGICFLHFIRG